jgi:hypothetical protein
MTTSPPILYCKNHPSIETNLRCNNCSEPICAKCAILTPTGYRCPVCVPNQQNVFDTTPWFDYPIAFIVITILSFLCALLISFISNFGLGFFSIFLSPLLGIALATVARAITGKRRSKRLFILTAAAAATGSALFIVGMFIGARGIPAPLALLWQGIFLITAPSTIYYRLAGIQMR